MARIVYPEDFLNQDLLLKNVIEKYDSFDSAVNPLTAFLAQHAIVLDDDAAAATAAMAYEKDRKEKAGEADCHTQRRDLAFGDMRAYYQYLKKFYSPAFMDLALWRAPILVSGRIAYPNAFNARQHLQCAQSEI